MDYRILQENSLEAMEEMVVEAMKAGYQPQGGVQVVSRGKIANIQQLGYIQAIVKYDEPA